MITKFRLFENKKGSEEDKFFELVSNLKDIYSSVSGFHSDGDEKDDAFYSDHTYRIGYNLALGKGKFPRYGLFQLEFCLFNPEKIRVVFYKSEGWDLNLKGKSNKEIDKITYEIFEKEIDRLSYIKDDLANAREYRIKIDKIDELINFINNELSVYFDAKNIIYDNKI